MAVYKNIYFTFLTQIPTMILGVLSGMFITRMIGAEGTGIYAIFQSNVELFTLFLSFSLNTAIIYFVANGKVPIEKLTGLGLVFILIGVASLVAIILPFKSSKDFTILFPERYNGFYYILYTIASFTLALFNAFVSALFQGNSRFEIVNRIALLNSVFNFLLFGSAYLLKHLLKLHFHTSDILLFSLIVLLLNSLVWFYYYLKELHIRPSFDFRMKEDIRPLFVFVIIGHLSHIINFINYKFDVYVVNHYCGQVNLGYYARAVNFAQIFWLISNPIINVLVPYLNGAEKEGKDKIFAYFSRLNFTIVSLASLCAFILAPFLFSLLYGREFLNSVDVYRILVPGIIFTCMTKFLSLYIYVNDRVHYNLIATIVGVLITIVLDLTLIPVMGISGAGLASTLSYLGILITSVYFAFRVMDLKYANYFILSRKEISDLFAYSLSLFKK